jgi:glycosyltransferase involved in cell wall biosynthesis
MSKRAQGTTVPISVVVPVFNRADLLDSALESVTAQTVTPEEVIVVDDGSEVPEAIEEVAHRHRARLIRQENAGPSAARNVGLASAKQPWVAFLDSDDMWLSRKLELQWTALSPTSGYGAVISNFRPVTRSGSFDETAFEVNAAYQTIQKRRICGDVYELCAKSAGLALARSMFVQPSGLLVERETALRIGGFDTRMRRGEDHEFALRLFAATRILAVENAVVRYRVHPQSLSVNEVEMRMGELALAERVLAHPERYPVGADNVIAQLRPMWVRMTAASFVKQGDVAAARRLLRSIVASDRSARTWVMFAATCLAPKKLPKAYTRLVLGLWRRRPWRQGDAWDNTPVLIGEMREARGDAG